MSKKQTETSAGGQDMGPFKAGTPFKFTDVQSLQLAIQAYFGSSDLSMGGSLAVGPSSVGGEHYPEPVMVKVFESVG